MTVQIRLPINPLPSTMPPVLGKAVIAAAMYPHASLPAHQGGAPALPHSDGSRIEALPDAVMQLLLAGL